MKDDFASRLDSIDQAVLAPLVRDVVGAKTAEIVDWTIEPVSGGATQETGRTHGIYRFLDSAQVQDQRVPWSLILKATSGSLEVDTEPQSWGYWKREVLAYQSGILADLPGNVVAPHCFGVTERPGDEFWLWLEDIPAEHELSWSLARYGRAARCLGAFNGAYLVGRSLPNQSWLSSGRVKDWLERSESTLQDLPAVSQHPLARRWFRDDSVERTLCLWRSREMLLQQLARLPRTFCHHDAFRRNLVFRPGPDRQEQLVAFDWEIAGIGVIGEEIATTVGITLQFLEFPIERAKALETGVYESYLAGLGDAGWSGDERLVRFGFAATASLYIGVGALGPFLGGLTRGEDPGPIVQSLFGCTPEQLADTFALLQGYLLDLGDEAVHLMEELS